MTTVPLAGGQVAFVSDEDAALVLKFKWYVTDKGYARSGRTTLMHHLILPKEPGYVTDHINGNRLDNRRENLRRCTPAQNQQNGRGWHKRTSTIKSAYRGVSWSKAYNSWVAKIGVGEGKTKLIGAYETEEDAAKAYDCAAAVSYGEFARPNFPDQLTAPCLSQPKMRAPAKMYRNNTSGYRGVHRHRSGWIVGVKVEGSLVYLGRFSTPVEAHSVAKVAFYLRGLLLGTDSDL